MFPTSTRDRAPMQKDFPDHHDAELVLKLYDLRREAVMRDSRQAINQQFWPKAWEDVQAVMKGDHPLNAPFRQTATYWEMVYGMARHGIVHPEFLLENSGEGLFLYARMKPHLAQYREARGNPREFQHAEWITTQTELGRSMLAMFEARVAKVLATK